MGKYLLNRNFKDNSIAPCGMNCGTCIAYLRTSKSCPGCRLENNDGKPQHCISCLIKNCDFFCQTKSEFCFDCLKFPCNRIKNLDKRYQQKYHISLIKNLENIKQFGLSTFIKNEQKRWSCQSCKSSLCVHRNHCLNCNKAILR